MSLVKGIHHMTVCVAGAQEDIDFQTQVFGQRMIKQTVLFDGRYAHYHLYYANANAEPRKPYSVSVMWSTAASGIRVPLR